MDSLVTTPFSRAMGPEREAMTRGAVDPAKRVEGAAAASTADEGACALTFTDTRDRDESWAEGRRVLFMMEMTESANF